MDVNTEVELLPAVASLSDIAAAITKCVFVVKPNSLRSPTWPMDKSVVNGLVSTDPALALAISIAKLPTDAGEARETALDLVRYYYGDHAAQRVGKHLPTAETALRAVTGPGRGAHVRGSAVPKSA